jgi:hypothetical protein
VREGLGELCHCVQRVATDTSLNGLPIQVVGPSRNDTGRKSPTLGQKGRPGGEAELVPPDRFHRLTRAWRPPGRDAAAARGSVLAATQRRSLPRCLSG